MIDLKDSLGIPNFGPWYLELSENQDSLKEITKICDFISDVVDNDSIPEFIGKNRNIQFINYGRTQLVFVVTIDKEKQYTLLVNQPAVKYGTGRLEFDNLNMLSSINPDLVIKPLHYINKDENELYVTPYHYQARCIGVNTDKWGMWVPEPEYHFVDFSDDERSTINSVMVSSLIKLYNEDTNMALAKVRLDGGDFMLEKGFEDEELTSENIIKNIKLIAARKLIPISLEDYINRIRVELSENNNKIIIGKKLRAPLTMEEIEKGIDLGLSLRKENSYLQQKGLKKVKN